MFAIVPISLLFLLVSAAGLFTHAPIKAHTRFRGDFICKSAANSWDVLQLPSAVISVKGEDRIKFLHNLGSNDFLENSALGSVLVSTTFLNAKGCLLAYAKCFLMNHEVKLIIPGSTDSSSLVDYFNKFIFPADKVKVDDDTEKFDMLILRSLKAGSHYSSALETEDPSKLSALLVSAFRSSFKTEDEIAVPRKGYFIEATIVGSHHPDKLLIAHGDDLTVQSGIRTYSENEDNLDDPEPIAKDESAVSSNNQEDTLSDDWTSHGLTVLSPKGTGARLAGSLLEKLYNSDSHPGGPTEWESLRLLYGRPADKTEISDNYTALEAGLVPALHFRKGCYVGNEIISKNVATNAVRRQLCAVSFDKIQDIQVVYSLLMDGKSVTLLDFEGDVVGKITSCMSPTSAEMFKMSWPKEEVNVFRALAYLRSSRIEAGKVFAVSRESILDRFDGVDENRVGPPLIRCTILPRASYPQFNVSASAAAPPAAKAKSKGKKILSTEEALRVGEALSEEEKRVAEKMSKMAEKLAAFQKLKKK